MSVNWKICDNCKQKVNADALKCPYCNHEFDDESDLNPDIKELYEYCELIDSRTDYSKTPTIAEVKAHGSVKSLVQDDLSNFLLYVAHEGESEDDDKLSFIRDNLGVDANFDKVKLIRNELPTSFKVFHENDLFHKDFLENNNLDGYVSRLFGIYRNLGDGLLKCGNTQPKAYGVLNGFMNNLAHSINQFKRNYSLASEPVDKNHLDEVLEALISCKSVDDVDEEVICDARNYINASVSGDENYDAFYEELSQKRPDVVASVIISSNSDYIFKGDGKPQEAVEEDEETLDDLLDELNELVGLEKVKKDVNSLINLVQIRKIRAQRGMKQPSMSLHLVFTGNPGTGKTTVARLLSKIYCKLGVISKGHLIETDRSGLVGGYLGQTAIKTQEVIQKAMGGILFIDEAYTLTPKSQNDSYGQEAIDTILKAMEDHRDDLIVIVAGYPDLMDKFIHSNPGLESRFNKYIFFEDYNPEELHGIFLSMCENSSLKLDSKADEYLKGMCEDIYNTRGENFANARQIRNIFENVLTQQANRLSEDDDITDEELMTILIQDFE